MDIVHSDLKPVRTTNHSYRPPLTIPQTNILIDSNFRPRLTDYGFVAIIADPNIVDPGSTSDAVICSPRYTAPELLNPSGFGLTNSNPTKKSDIYAFGVATYQVSVACFM